MESLDKDVYDGRLFKNQTLYCEGAIKPFFRGHIHYFILFSGILVIALIDLLKSAKTSTTAIIAVLFMLSFAASYTASTFFHNVEYDNETEIFIQKLDHVAISFAMYFTVVPVSLLLPLTYRIALLGLTTGFLLLNLYNIFKSPSNIIYELGIIGMGVLFLPVLYYYMTGFEWACAMTIVFFGVITGFMFFTETNLPFISPAIFGYHEIAHLLLGISHIFGFFMVRSIFSRTLDDV